MIVKLDKNVLDYLKNTLSLRAENKFGKDYIDVINGNMNSIKQMLVGEISKDKGALLVCKASEIVISTAFAEFDSNNKFLRLNPIYKKFLYSQLGHELLHAASSSYGCSGIIHFTDFDDTPRPLNEGITQMLTEELYGYVVSPFSDVYKDYKKIAKILYNTFGAKPILDSYFYHSDDLKNSMNKLSENQDYYKKTNESLYFADVLKKSLSKGTMFHEIKSDYIKLIYRSILINVVIKKLKLLNIQEKKQYIKSILISVSDDNEIYEYVYNLLIDLMKMNDDELKNERDSLYEKENALREKTEFAHILYDDKDKAFEKIFVDIDGNISLIKNRKITITDKETCSDIYYELFLQSNFKWELNRIINDYYYSGYMDFTNKSILQKRKIFEAIKADFKKRNLLIIDEYSDIENNSIYTPNFISLPSKSIMSFHDLRVVAEKYKVIIIENENGNKSFSIIDRKTQIVIHNEYMEKIALVANLWLVSSNNKTNEDEDIPGINDAFSIDKQYIYDSIMQNVKTSIERTGQINIEALLKIAKLSKDTEYLRIVNFIFKYPEACDWIFKFVKSYISNSAMQTEKDKSLIELENESYIDESIDNKINSMFSKI